MTTVSAGAYTSTKTRASLSISPALAVAALSSLGAGAIHAAAIGAHGEHHQAVLAFTAVAFAQIAFGVFALMYPRRLVMLAGAVANAGFFAGWVLAKTSGISFIDGLEQIEPVQFADGVAAALAAVAVLAGVAALISGLRSIHVWHSTLAMSALLTALVAVPAMVSAGSHSHAGAHAHGTTPAAAGGHTHAAGTPGGGGHVHTAAPVPPKKYDPTKPIDLSGVPGVTPEQQARAENLIAITLIRLPQFADYHVAEAAGFRSIGDAFTGDEHFINLSYFHDGRILDPDHPESLVYEPDGKGGKKLAAVMFMLETGQTLADVPDVGGKLTQWHIHNNLCFTVTGRVAGLTSADGSCSLPLVKGPDTPMIHVWIRPNPCGPFAALEGVGGGQIAAGQTRLCDTVHGA
ncbi:MAG: hypothetical protein QOF28_317 [Actinomycetota bacterium]|nr:hypothetical protein [Actinomycetota bacterium]